MSAINDSGSLFEVNVPEFKLLRQCRRELKMLKVCWCHWLLCGRLWLCVVMWSCYPWIRMIGHWLCVWSVLIFSGLKLKNLEPSMNQA
jgi:hypothetical protein